jgi:hypothetical protein
MFEEFAIDPELFTEWEFFKELRDKFGIPQGRFIADYPHKAWKKAAAELLEKRSREANPVRNSSTVIEWMKSPGGGRDLRFVRRQLQYVQGRSWIENAETQAESFKAIVSEKESAAGNAIRMQETTCMAEEPLFRIDTQPRIPRTDTALVAIAKPLLKYAKRVKWVDRFLATANEHEQTVFKTQAVVECLDWMRSEGHAPELLELHLEWVGCDNCRHLVDGLRRILKRHMPPAMQMSIHWWAASKEENIHPRFLLTDVGGLQYDHGTDPGRGTTIVHLLQEKRLRDEWSRYTPESSNLTHHGEAFLFPG